MAARPLYRLLGSQVLSRLTDVALQRQHGGDLPSCRQAREPRPDRLHSGEPISDIIVNTQTGTGNRIEYWNNHGAPYPTKGKIRRYIDIGRLNKGR